MRRYQGILSRTASAAGLFTGAKVMNYRHLFAASVALAACACCAPMAHAQGINVTVDGEVVPFSGQQPVERAGTILVPLRGVFEKLGATVGYDSSTKTIIAIQGPKTVTLKL